MKNTDKEVYTNKLTINTIIEADIEKKYLEIWQDTEKQKIKRGI